MTLHRRNLAVIVLVIGTFSIVPSHAAVVADELTPAEFSVLSAVLHKRQPLQESDLNELRAMVKNYYVRTRHYFTTQDVRALTDVAATTNGYYYALAQSMLISWDSNQYQTTKAFDSLYRKMQQHGGRKPEKLAHDRDRVRLAAQHAPFETDEGGTRHKLDRTQIVNTMNQINIAADNVEKVVSVLNDMTH